MVFNSIWNIHNCSLLNECFHYLPILITESHNGLGWKRPQGSWISNPPARQGHQPPHLLDQVTQGPIQPDLEHLQGQDIHNLSGQPVPAPHHSHSKELPPDIQPKSALLQLKTIWISGQQSFFMSHSSSKHRQWRKMDISDRNMVLFLLRCL